MSISSATLDLILLISAVFFVVADIILALGLGLILPNYIIKFDWYPAFGQEITFLEAAEKCSCLYAVFPNGTNELIPMDKIPYPQFYLKHSPEEVFANFPFMVSLHEKMYENNMYTGKTRFGCSGVMLGKNRILAANFCFTRFRGTWPRLETILVRAHSPYVDRLGSEHGVVAFGQTAWHNYLEMITQPSFPKFSPPDPELNYDDIEGPWSYGYSVGWESEFANDDIGSNELSVKTWTTVDTPPDIESICETYSPKNTTRVFFTNCYTIIAVYWNEVSLCKTHRAIKYKKRKLEIKPCTND